ncbi:RHS repeat-associated core domain-containing protein [Dyella koreensis]|uniref:RHS repeat protein n=1 Tax=Dyella koreensis TaxID=311235 RepID=A0ABW8K707_9GAMM
MKKRMLCSLIALSLSAITAHATTPDRTTTNTYNAQGLLQSVDGPRTDVNDVTHYTYDTSGRLATITDALGHVTSYDTYDMYGNPGRSIDPNGVVSVMTYTPEGWPLTLTRDSTGAPSTTTLTHDAIGNITQSKDADGVITSYTYDDAGRLTDIADAVGNRIHYTLDAAGNRLKEETFDSSNTLKRSASRTYSSLSQVLTVVDAFNRTILNFNYPDGYDAAGNPVHSSDAAGIQRKRGYDALHRLVSTIDNYNGTDTATKDTQSVSSYDASDHLEGVGDPDGLNTIYSYNGLDDLKSVQSPDAGTTSYVYDTAGNAIQRTDAKGITSTSTFDALNRRTATTYSDSSLNVAYFYDEPNSTTGCVTSAPIGRLTRIVENAVTTSYCYDTRGNVVQKRQTQGTQTDTIGYSYSLAGRLASTLTPSGTSVQYSRDAAGRISSVTALPSGATGAGTGNTVSNIVYLPFGPVTSYTLGNGQTITRAYDANYALTDVTSSALNLHFAHDAMGNITALGNNAGANPATETYSYDPLYRLTGVSSPSGTAIEAYTYSKTGDRLSKTSAGLATGTYGYQANTHWLTSIGTSARSYDANGNTTGNSSGGETFGYGYNERNRLTVVQRNGQTVATYVYNAAGQRIAKAATFPQSVNLRFAYDENSQLMGEYGSTNRDYIWLGDMPVAVVDTTGTASTVNFVHADGLNTPRAVTDANGTTIWQWDLQGNPFGEQSPIAPTGYVFNLRLPGQYHDVESGLAYNGNRDYEAAIGRYVQSDPIGLRGGLNTYAYVGGNPLSRVDPLGLRVTFAGDLDTQRALHTAYDCVGSTAYGAALIYALVMSPVEYTIANEKANDAYFSPRTNTISVDPNFHPLTLVDVGLTLDEQSAPTSAILGHEIGHAATRIRDTGPGNMDNVISNENPIRSELGLPPRVAY